MARKSPLKVFRTSIGFQDAYVAATSRKAALQAWGTDKDLFARGSAEVVTDPALTAEPLASPGKIVKRARGSLREHLSAAAIEPVGDKAVAKARGTRPVERRPPPPKPRPSRARLEAAENALAALRAKAAEEMAELERREDELARERKALATRHRRAGDELDKELERERDKYERALERWRRNG